jgi:hypothetical protein
MVTVRLFSDASATEELKDLWLLQDLGKPLPPPPAPSSDADAVVVVFEEGPGEDATTTVFSGSDPDVAARVANLCDYIYVKSGMRYLEALESSLQKADDKYAINQRHPFGPGPLLPAYFARLNRIKRFAREAVPVIEDASQGWAFHQLSWSHTATEAEARRYLSGAGEDWWNMVLGGPEVAGLVQALAGVGQRVVETQYAARMYATFLPSSGAPSSLTEADPPGLQRNIRKDFESYKSVLRPEIKGQVDAIVAQLNSKPSSVQAEAQATKAQAQLAADLQEACAAYPVIYRLWNKQVAKQVATIWFSAAERSRVSAVVDDSTPGDNLRDSLRSVVTSTLQNNIKFQYDLTGSSASIVWRYGNAVAGGLRTLGISEGMLAWRAAADKLASGQDALLPTLSDAAQALQLAADLTIEAPPVTAIIEGLAAALSLANLAEELLSKVQNDRAFGACLDPAESLALAPSVYSDIAINGVCLFFQVKGMFSSG